MTMPSIAIVCTAFPPLNATGARRPYQLAAHLTKMGHRVSVITTRGSGTGTWHADTTGMIVHRYPTAASMGGRGLFQRTMARVLGSGGDRPNAIARTLSFFLLPLEFHIRPVLTETEGHARLEPSDIVVASGPGWSTFEIGAQLAKAWGSTFLVDYRDPWSVKLPEVALRTTTWYGNGLSGAMKRAWYRHLERRSTAGAHGATAVSAPLLRNAERFLRTMPTGVIRNGVAPLRTPPPQTTHPELVVLHSGRLYHEQDWSALVHATEQLHASGVDPSMLQIHLLGAESEDTDQLSALHACARRTGLITITERVDREVARAWEDSADLLLHLGFKGKIGIMPLKLLEYLGAGKPILHLGHGQTEIEETIERTRTGIIVRSGQELLKVLRDHVDMKRSGRPIPFQADGHALSGLGWESCMEQWRQFIIRVHALRT